MRVTQRIKPIGDIVPLFVDFFVLFGKFAIAVVHTGGASLRFGIFVLVYLSQALLALRILELEEPGRQERLIVRRTFPDHIVESIFEDSSFDTVL